MSAMGRIFEGRCLAESCCLIAIRKCLTRSAENLFPVNRERRMKVVSLKSQHCIATFRHLEEQNHFLLTLTGPREPNAHTVCYLAKRFYYVVDLRASETDSVRVERAITTRENMTWTALKNSKCQFIPATKHHDASSIRIDLAEIAVSPDAFELRKVRLVVLGVVGVVVEVGGHARERLCAHQLTTVALH